MLYPIELRVLCPKKIKRSLAKVEFGIHSSFAIILTLANLFHGAQSDKSFASVGGDLILCLQLTKQLPADLN